VHCHRYFVQRAIHFSRDSGATNEVCQQLDFGQIFDRRISARNAASPLAISFPELKKEKAVGFL
jgi:hypothetical protein